ncbi:hypothetical protein F4780DRAFT_233513 [Xylariomycetidae sp. FL0641]|nr:hypothetical protein F4780DRAFT_233513 [Xylariomycetidae sp. FL0641]
MADPRKDKATYLSVVQACDNFPYDADVEEAYYQLLLPGDALPHGYLLPATVAKMPWTSQFRVTHTAGRRRVEVLDASAGADPSAAVTAAFAELINTCVERDLFHVLAGQHSEPFAVVGAPYPVHLERFAAALFGTVSRGAHLTAYTLAPGSGEMRLWIPRRAAHLYTSPGLLDATVAGGVKAGVSPRETIVAEAGEEASLPADLVRELVKPAGVLSYISVTGPGFPGEQGLVIPDLIYVFEAQLPADVVLTPNDDEVQGFQLMSVHQVQDALLKGEFKPDAAIVLVDFFIRHGIINADNENEIVQISMHLHRRLPFRTELVR